MCLNRKKPSKQSSHSMVHVFWKNLLNVNFPNIYSIHTHTHTHIFFFLKSLFGNDTFFPCANRGILYRMITRLPLHLLISTRHQGIFESQARLTHLCISYFVREKRKGENYVKSSAKETAEGIGGEKEKAERKDVLSATSGGYFWIREHHVEIALLILLLRGKALRSHSLFPKLW